MPTVLSPPRHLLVEHALRQARQWCAGHVIDDRPALAHAARVAVTLGEHVADPAPELIAAALLHDAPEFAPTDIDLDVVLGRCYGPEVLRIVRALEAEHHALDRMASARAAGAERPPFGPCHGELHPSALHISHAGWHLLDLAMAFTGPGLLDLAAWSGLRQPANPPRTRGLIEHYVRSGGHRDALADRGGLPAERWALGWHRIQAAAWLLACATSGLDEPATDPRHLLVLRRQLTSARELLAA